MRMPSWNRLVLAISFLALFPACRQGVRLSPAGPFVPKTECYSCSLFDDFETTSRLYYSEGVLGEWVIQTDLEWYDFEMMRASGGGIYPMNSPEPPVDLTQKTILVKIARFISTTGIIQLVPNEICFSPDRVTVRYDMDEQCSTGWIQLSPSTMMFAIDKTDRPVVWEGTFYPYEGAPCEPVTFSPPLYPVDPPFILHPYNSPTHDPR